MDDEKGEKRYHCFPSHRPSSALFFSLPSLPTTQRGLWRGERYLMTNRTVSNNDDGDGNKIGRKVIGFRASCFFVHFFPSLQDYDVKHVLWRTWNRTTIFFFFFSTSIEFKIHVEFNFRKIRSHLTNWTRWNKRDEVWSSTNLLFMERFRSCRRRWCLSSVIMHLLRWRVLKIVAYSNSSGIKQNQTCLIQWKTYPSI